MEISDRLDAVRTNSALLARAARAAGPEVPVPGCPEWTMADLLGHISAVHRWVTEIVQTKAQERVRRSGLPQPGAGDDLVEWFEAGAAGVAAALESVDPDAPLWWPWASAGPAPARCWIRRMAHETAIHRVDAESAAGGPGPVEPAELAADGIDELLELLAAVPAGPDDGLAGLPASYHFHTTDVPGEWLIATGGDGRVAVRREHAKADVAVRGPASDLELFLYSRRGADGLDVFGDPALVAAWSERIRF